MLISQLCTQAQLEVAEYRQWCQRMREPAYFHRKPWEFYFIAQALSERDMLRPGRRGLGFGVGREPLTALFASYGCSIVATDQSPGEGRRWQATGEHATGLSSLNDRDICPADRFVELVSFRIVDMNAIPDDLRDFDFVWSSCAFEHIGSLARGRRFVRRAMDCLRPGGVAVHTTEYAVNLRWFTIPVGRTVFFRERDIRAIQREAEADGHRLELNLDPGSDPMDRHIDRKPYHSEPHLKLRIGPIVTTSIGLIITKAGQPK
jgi:SAM-dependent methyltransferase